MVGDGAGLDELANLGGEILADAGDREPLGRREVGDPLGGVGDRLRGVAVCADLERVLALDFEEIADFGEHTRDGQVVEATGCRLRLRPSSAASSTRRPSVSMVKSRSRPPWRRAPAGWPGRRSGSPRQNRQPPPPAPQTLPPNAPASRAAARMASISGVVTPGARPLRFSHSSAICRPTSRQSPALERRRAWRTAMSRMRAKRCCTSRSPSMWRLVTSQLLMPELRRRAGVGEHQPRFQLARRDGQRDAAHAVDAELHRRDAAVERRPVVLDAGRHVDRLRLDVHRNLHDVGVVCVGVRSRPSARRTRRC